MESARMFRSARYRPRLDASAVACAVTIFLLRVRNGFSTNGLRRKAERLGAGTTLIRKPKCRQPCDEKLKEEIVGELERQAPDRRQTLSVSYSPDLFVNGK
jgi:hypothetical protein